MCLQIKAVSAVPELTERIAQAAFPKGNFCLKMRQEMGTLFTDQDFAELYSKRGQPALAPWQLALVTVMQFVEDLSDRQAAEAVRARIDWKYALGLELTDPGFDYSVLCEFRKRLVQGGKERLLLDRLLSVFRDKKLLKTRGRQRTDSTHVLAAIRVMNRLELVVETLRATLNALAAVDPLWLHSVAPDDWYSRYRQRAEQSRLPRGEKARKEYAEQVGNDGLLLMQLLDAKDARRDTEKNTEKEANPEKSLQMDLNTLAAVQTLRQMWERHYIMPDPSSEADALTSGTLTWRKEADLTRAAMSIESPYDTQARHSTKRDIRWTGYKVHLTETCDPDLPRIVTHVQTTVATTQDISCTVTIQQALAEADLLPSRHLVDTGYVDAAVLVSSRELHNVELFGPPRDGQSWQAREGGYDQSRFRIDWSKQEVTCPEGKVSAGWGSFRSKPYDREIVKVRFADRDCVACPSRSQCVRSPRGQSRSLVLPPQAHYEALQQMRGQIDSEEGAKEYRKRAGIEGSLSQGIRRSDLRHARYRGLSKTHLQHLATAAALNLLRVVVHLQGMPLARTRVSRFAQRAA